MRRLLIRPGAIGDFIVSLPAMESLRATYTEVWCAGQNVPLARFADCARSITAVGLERVGFLNADDVIARLRSFDSVVSWYGANRAEFRTLMDDLGIPVQFLPALPDGTCHSVDFYNQQARGLGGQPIRFPKIDVPKLPRTHAVIHPFASALSKRAPIELFRRAEAILSEHMPVHWTCGPEESLTGAVRFDDLHQLAAWLSSAKVFLGNDSGISHLAAAVGTPVVVYFRTSNAKVWAPRGPTVHVMHLGG